MRVIVDIPKDTVKDIADIVEDSGYNDTDEFIHAAVRNQVRIEKDSGSDKIENSNVQTLEEATSVYQEGSKKSEDADKISSAESLQLRNYSSIDTVAAPSSHRIDQGPLWGQYNRILPVKIVVRQLANAVQNNDEGQIDFTTFKEAVAESAREYGLRIEEQDQRKSRKRGEKLSSGLPTGDDPEKSKDRFVSHFVGRIDSEGSLTGAPAQLQLVNILERNGRKISITSSGLQFAEISNPLIDGDIGRDKTLSQKERDFYIDHVRSNLPEEMKAMKLIAHSVNKGRNRPDELTNKISQINTDWTDTQSKTMRTGLVSRMIELNLLKRVRVGQRGVGYELTMRGNDFIDKSTEVES